MKISMIGVIFALFFMSASFFVTSRHTDEIMNGVGSCMYSDCNSCQMDSGCGYCYREDEGELLENFCVAIDKETGYSESGLCSNGTKKEEEIWWTDSYCPSSYSYLSLIAMVFYLAMFAPGMGTMPWAVNAEIYSQEARAAGNSLATTTNWISNFVVSLTFLSLSEAITSQGAFLVYAALSILGLIFMHLLTPETKGVSLEDIPKKFEKSWIQAGKFCTIY